VLVRCPQCHSEFRLVEFEPDQRVVRYLCPGCDEIVRLDLALDEVPSSSSSGSFRSLERRSTVLVADDSPAVRHVAASLLQRADFNVLLARDGEDALQKLREEHPDLMVLDLLMPGTTGFEVLRRMRSEERIRETRVIVMSSVFKGNVQDYLEELGVRGFIDKTQLAAELVPHTRRILDAASGESP
jgi:CheY-like chemotaxis protein